MNLLKPGRPVHRPGRGHFTFGNVAAGTVADAHPGGFTVIMGPGQRVPVTTSGQTTVITMRTISIGGLRTGEKLDAAVTSGPRGTLTAAAIDHGSNLPTTESTPAKVGCSPSAVAAEFLRNA